MKQLSLFDANGEALARCDAQQLRQVWSYLPSMSGTQARATIAEIEARERFAGLSLRSLCRWEQLESRGLAA